MSRHGVARRAVVAAALLLLACAPLSARAEGDTDAAATRAARDEADPCTDVDVFAVFPKHLDGAETHARFDLRALNASALGPGGGNLGYIEGSSSAEYDTKVTASFCLPRGQGFFLIASGNATRGSAFGRFTVSVTSREYYNMTLFSAGSDWTRGAAYDTDEPRAALADGALSAFLEDRGVGPPLWDTSDASHTYELHGRARFDTWGRNPAAVRTLATSATELEEADAFYAECGALVAVFVGCPSHGNGAKPGDMSWAIVPRGETSSANALASVHGDAFQWGASVAHVVCLPAGDYDVLAFDAGSAGRGWGYGATLDALELMESDGEFFHGFVLNSDSGDPAWFTHGKTARLEISPTGRTKAPVVRLAPEAEAAAEGEKAAALGGVRVAKRDASRNTSRNTSRKLLASSDTETRVSFAETGLVTRGAAATALVALAVAAAAAAAAAAMPGEDLAALLKQKPGSGSAAARARLVRSRAHCAAYGAEEGSENLASVEVPIVTARDARVSTRDAARVSKAALAVAAAAGVVAAAGNLASGGDGATLTSALGALAHARPSLGAGRGARARLGAAGASMCGLGIPGCSILEPPACEGRAYAYKPGMLAHLQGGTGAATALAASAEWAGDLHSHAADPALVHSLVDVNHGLCDVVERIEGTSLLDWSEPESHGLPLNFTRSGALGLKDAKETRARGDGGAARVAPPVARLGDASSGCVHDLGGFENATLERCREACRRDDGCTSYHAFRLVRFDESDIVFDPHRNEDAHADYSCRICGAGGEGAFVPDFEAEATIDSVRGPAWCLTEHRVAFAADAVEECAAACDATAACDAFNFGEDHGDCMLLRLGADATAGAVWRGSAGSRMGVAGYATYYAVSPAAIEAAAAASDAVAAADAAAQTALAPSRAERACRAGGNATDDVTRVEDFVAGDLDEEAGAVADASSLTESSGAMTTTESVRVIVLDTAGDAARRPAAPPAPAADDDASSAADSATRAPATSSASPTPTPAASPSPGASASAEASPTPAATPVVERSGAAENVDAAEDIEEALDEPVSASDDASDPMSGDDGVTTPEETTEHAVEASADRAAHVVSDGATAAAKATEESVEAVAHVVSDGATAAGEATEDGVETVARVVSDGARAAGEATEDGVETVAHVLSDGARAAGDATEDGFHDASVATVNAVDGAVAAVDGAMDRLTHGNESDDWADAQLVDAASDADAAADASKPAATHPGPSSSSSASSDAATSAIPFDSDAFEPSFQETDADSAAAEARMRADAVYDDEGADAVASGSQPAKKASPPPAPVYLPEVMPTILETCDTCATPPCRAFQGDVKETEFIVHADSCCQATRWAYGNTGAFTHTCGACAENGETMTFARALHHCSEAGGGLCANNQVTAASRTPGCAAEEDAEVWTSESCGAHDEGRFVMRAGGGGRRCEFELEKEHNVVCCANTCNTFIPDHMCPAEDARAFWQASAEASASAAASAAMGAARLRDPKVRVALPELPTAAKGVPTPRTEGTPFRAAALGSPEDKEAVLRAARDAMAATTK